MANFEATCLYDKPVSDNKLAISRCRVVRSANVSRCRCPMVLSVGRLVCRVRRLDVPFKRPYEVFAALRIRLRAYSGLTQAISKSRPMSRFRHCCIMGHVAKMANKLNDLRASPSSNVRSVTFKIRRDAYCCTFFVLVRRLSMHPSAHKIVDVDSQSCVRSSRPYSRRRGVQR
jgi:hypothetical protein